MSLYEPERGNVDVVGSTTIWRAPRRGRSRASGRTTTAATPTGWDGQTPSVWLSV